MAVLRFRTERRRPAYVRAHMKDAARWINAGLRGTVTLEHAVVEAFLALNAAHGEVLRGELDREAS